MRVCIIKIWPESEIENIVDRLKKFKHEIVDPCDQPDVVIAALSNKFPAGHPIFKIAEVGPHLPMVLWPDDEQLVKTDWLEGSNGDSFVDMLFCGVLQQAFKNRNAEIDLSQYFRS